jgi:GTP-binding protein
VPAEFLTSAAGPEGFPPETLPEVAFLGRSNAGKSTLLNGLVGRPGLAFVSSRPGCTQLINFYRVDDQLQLVDLPGYGYAAAPVAEKRRWQQLIELYLLNRKNLRLAVVLLDARRGWMEADRQLREWLEYHQLPYLVVATKLDKLNRKEENQQLAAIRKELNGRSLIASSAKTGRGMRELWQTISRTPTR